MGPSSSAAPGPTGGGAESPAEGRSPGLSLVAGGGGRGWGGGSSRLQGSRGGTWAPLPGQGVWVASCGVPQLEVCRGGWGLSITRVPWDRGPSGGCRVAGGTGCSGEGWVCFPCGLVRQLPAHQAPFPSGGRSQGPCGAFPTESGVYGRWEGGREGPEGSWRLDSVVRPGGCGRPGALLDLQVLVRAQGRWPGPERGHGRFEGGQRGLPVSAPCRPCAWEPWAALLGPPTGRGWGPGLRTAGTGQPGQAGTGWDWTACSALSAVCGGQRHRGGGGGEMPPVVTSVTEARGDLAGAPAGAQPEHGAVTGVVLELLPIEGLRGHTWGDRWRAGRVGLGPGHAWRGSWRWCVGGYWGRALVGARWSPS